MMQECEFVFGFDSESDSKKEVPPAKETGRNFNDQGILYKVQSVSQ